MKHVTLVTLLYVALIYAFPLPAWSQMLKLHCEMADEKYNKYDLIINFTRSTFTLYRNSIIDEDEDVELVSVSPAKIVLYSSYGGSEMFVDRVNGSLTVIRNTYPCALAPNIPTTPKF